MKITSLKVENVRAHSKYRLVIEPNITLITGANGSGKTTLLEAVYIALQGTSFKGSDDDILSFKAPWYRIDVGFSEDVVRTVTYNPERASGKKQFKINGKTNYRLSYTNKYPVVLFDPDELRLINGSPSRRRQFLDRFICQFDPEYALSLRRYERALKQRNILLKSRSNKNSLFVWDIALSKYGAYIIQRRIELIDELKPKLEAVYKEIAQSDDGVMLSYSVNYADSVEQKLLSELHKSIDRDMVLGYTSVGPHRHDILFELNDVPAADTASRGEVRTIVLALKFLEVDILRSSTDKDPVILLDDVFSELDEPRQKALMERFSSYQTVITSVAAPTKSGHSTVELGGSSHQGS